MYVEAPQPKRRWVKRSLLLLPWLVLVPVLAEFVATGFPLLWELTNPYIVARRDGLPCWPHEGADSALVEQVRKASLVELPEPTPSQEIAAHAIYLLTLDDATIETCAQEYGRNILWHVDEPVGTWKSFGPPLPHGLSPNMDNGTNGGIAPPAFVEEWRRALDQSEPMVLSGGAWKDWVCRARTEDPDGDGPVVSSTVLLLTSIAGMPPETMLISQLEMQPVPEDSPYRFPFLDFKLHGGPSRRTDFFGLPEFRLNNYGFRDDDVAVPKPPGVFRVACVGASTTMEGPTNGFTYPNLVEGFLKERFPGRQIEVVNCGVSGIATEGERSRFADYLMLDPNVLIYYNAVNQICRSDLQRWMLDHPMRASALVASRAAAVWLGDFLGPAPDELRGIFTDRGQANVFAMAEAAKQFGVLPILTTFCHPDGPNLSSEERVYYEHDARMNWVGRGFTLDTYLRAITLWNDMLREECATRDIALIDVAAQLTGGGQVFGDLCHMKDYGIEQKARVVAAGLEPYVEAFYAGTAPPAP